jgi:hypothetical protein
MISITLTPEEARLVIASLSVSARDYRTSADSYESDTKERVLKEAATCHDLCEVISSRLKGAENRQENKQRMIDPYDNWPLNDPRKW